MKITFYGVRGSIASPGPNTAKYGGNTSCVYVELSNNKSIILDAGTGIRELGKRLAQSDEPINLLLSHSHWDHIQGYPFFAPIYQAGRTVNVYTGESSDRTLLCSLFDQMDGSNFPLKVAELPSSARCVVDNVERLFGLEGIMIKRKPLNHPGGGFGYRIEDDGKSCVFITDNELDPPNIQHTRYDEWVAFCHGTDVLIHDAQYLQNDMPHKHGWGHSLVSQVRELAVDAEVKALVMFHHDPDRSDSELDQIQLENAAYFQGKRLEAKCFCAAEGMVIEV